jgi:hypothetical protein
MTPGIRHHTFTGTAWWLGHQHGVALGPQIRAFIADDLQRLNKILPRPTSLDELAPMLGAYCDAISHQLPGSIEEISGLAVAAEINFHQALLLQLRREVVGYSRITRGDCTTFARHAAGEPVVAQTVDLNGDLETEAYVVRVTSAGSDGRELLMLTFTGLLGYLGMNSHGLAIGLNLVMGGTWRPGIPGYLAIRHLLETARSMDECIALLDRLDLASSRSLTICDRHGVATVEILDTERRWHAGAELVHTNHFLDPELAGRDEINVFARNGSVARRAACLAALAELPAAAPWGACFAVLDRAPICIPPDGNPRREATVARVVMKPRSGELAVKLGAQPDARPQVFRIGEPA